MSCIDGKGSRTFCGKEECLYHYEKSFASFQGMCCGASDSKECEENGCNCGKKKVDCWDKEKNGDIMPYMVSKGTSAKYDFICNICNLSWQPPLNRITAPNESRWCPECGKKKTKTWTTKKFLEKIIVIHGEMYGYDKTIYIKMTENIIVNCYKHGYFTISAHSHIQGRGCTKCGIEKSAEAKRYTFEEIQSFGMMLHSNKYEYLKIIIEDGRTIIVVNCPNHGEFKQLASSHVKGKGCIKCAQERTGIKNRRLFEEYTEEANKIYDNYYIYMSIYYKEYSAIFIIKCPKHGLFEQSVMSHLSGRGCKHCGIKKRSLLRYLTNEVCIQRGHESHGTLYDYSLVEYKGYYEAIQIICKKHGAFWMKACNHFKGYGCYSCNKHSSKPAREWLSFIQSGSLTLIQTNDSPNGEYKIPSTKYSSDGFNQINTIYEFHGSFWHGDPSIYQLDTINSVTGTTMGELYQKTQEKKQRCIELGYNYVEIWESKWYRFKKFIRMIQLRFRKRKSNPI